MRRPAGFSILELVVVLMLMSILAAVVVGRSVTTANLELNAAADQVRSHLRYAQAHAMKRQAVWGISYSSGVYWLFETTPSNRVRLPGVDSDQVNLANDISMSNLSDLFFDRIGKPYTAYTSSTSNTPLTTPSVITLSAGDSRSITVTPETGLIR